MRRDLRGVCSPDQVNYTYLDQLPRFRVVQADQIFEVSSLNHSQVLAVMRELQPYRRMRADTRSEYTCQHTCGPLGILTTRTTIREFGELDICSRFVD